MFAGRMTDLHWFPLTCALLFLAFPFRRVSWTRWALTGAGFLVQIGEK